MIFQYQPPVHMPTGEQGESGTFSFHLKHCKALNVFVMTSQADCHQHLYQAAMALFLSIFCLISALTLQPECQAGLTSPHPFVCAEPTPHPLAVITTFVASFFFDESKSHSKWQDISGTEEDIQKKKRADISGWLPSAHSHCYYIAACATTRAVRSIFPLWIECNLPSAL